MTKMTTEMSQVLRRLRNGYVTELGLPIGFSFAAWAEPGCSLHRRNLLQPASNYRP